MKTVFIRRCTLAVVLTTGLALGVRPCAATSYIWNVGSGDWSVAANWNPNGVPGANDDASIGGGTVTVSTDTTVSNLNFTGGTINGSAILNVVSNLTWTGGTMSGSGKTTIASGATATISAINTSTLGRTMLNAGTVTVNGNNSWTFAPGVVFTNQAGGIVNVTQGATFAGDGTPGFHNEGTFTKTASADGSEFNGVAFHNRGSTAVNVAGGVLELNTGGAHTSDFTVASGATLLFNGTHTLSAAVDITGAGNLTVAGGTFTDAGAVNLASGTFSSGTATFSGSYSNSTALTVNGGTVNFNVPPTLGPTAAVTFSSGTLTVNGDLTISGSLLWTGGLMNGPGKTTIASGATATISAFNTSTLGRTMLNAGTVAVNGNNSWTFAPGVVFTNQAGGIVNVIQGATFAGDGTPGFHNEGTFTKTASADGSEFNGVAFHNRGSTAVNVAGGVLELNTGGAHTSDFTVASGATLLFNGTHTLSAAVDITGAGNLTVAGGTFTDAGAVNLASGTFSSGTATFSGSYSNSVSLTINGGTANFDVPPTLAPSAAVNLVAPGGGTLSINGDLTIGGTLTWTHGTMSGAGKTIIGSSATANIGAGDTATLARTLENRGTASINGVNHWFFSNGALFTNAPGAVISVTQGANLFNNGTGATFDNAGTFNNTAGGADSFLAGVTFNNSGVVNALVGVLNLEAGGTHAGDFTIASGAFLHFVGAHTLQSTADITGAGKFRVVGGTLTDAGTVNTGLGEFSGGTATFSGSYSNNTSLTVNGGTAIFNPPPTLGPTAAVTFSSGTLTVNGDLTIQGTFTWTGGLMNGPGKTTLAAGAIANISNSSDPTLSRTMVNAGTMTMSGVHAWFFGVGAQFTNLVGAVFNHSDGRIHRVGSSGQSFNNAGTYTRTAIGASGTSFTDMTFNNSGSVLLQVGTFGLTTSAYVQSSGLTLLNGGNIANDFPLQIVGGTLGGTGTISGSISNNAAISPGASPGLLTINGNYTQTSAGVLNIEVAGTSPGTQFDKLAVTGTAALAGTLNASLTNGFNPSPNALFTFLTAATVSGTFGTFNFPSTQVGLALNYTATNAAIQVINVAPTIPAIASQTNDEQVAFSLNVNATDADTPPQTLTYSLVNSPAGASINGSGDITWTPAEAQGPMVTNITVLVTDSGSPNLIASRTFPITVNEINVAPGLALPPNTAFNEQTLFSANAVASDSDIPANSLTVELVSGPAGLTVSPAGGISWTPDESQGSNTYTVSLRVTDLNTNAVNAQQISVTNSFQLTVNESNRPPVLTVPATQTVAEQTTLTVTNTAADPDLPANGLTFSLVSPPSGATVNPTTGVLTWTPDESQGPSTNVITVRVTDENLPAVNAQNLTDTKNFTVIVTEQNASPVLTLPPSISINELAPYNATATATDSDIPSQSLTFALVSGPAGLTVSSGGAIAWIPTEAQGPGVYPVSISVSDGVVSVTNSYTLTVNEVVSNPTISDIPNQTLQPNTNTGALPFTIGDVETPAGSLTVSASSSNPGLVPVGNIVFGGGGANRTVQVTPVGGQAGSATITVTVTDESNASASDQFVVSVLTSLAVEWFTMDGGGGASTNSTLGLGVTGTIGQPDAGRLTGATLAIEGGFWGAIAVVQTPGAPLLSIAGTATNTVIVSWPSPSDGFVLQQNTDLSTTNWTTPGETVNDSGGLKFIIVNPPMGNRFYRLFKP